MSTSTTVGGSSDTLDAQSTAWFNTFCTGFGQVKDIGTAMAPTTGGDSAKTAGQAIQKLGQTFTTTASKLKAQAPPTFDGGADFAAKVEQGLGQAGAALTSAGQKAAGGDMSALTSLESAITPLEQNLSGIDATPQLKAAVLKVPACKVLDADSSSGGTTS